MRLEKFFMLTMVVAMLLMVFAGCVTASNTPTHVSSYEIVVCPNPDCPSHTDVIASHVHDHIQMEYAGTSSVTHTAFYCKLCGAFWRD